MPGAKPPEFQRRAVDLARSGDHPVAMIAADLESIVLSLRRWMVVDDAEALEAAEVVAGSSPRPTPRSSRQPRSSSVMPPRPRSALCSSSLCPPAPSRTGSAPTRCESRSSPCTGRTARANSSAGSPTPPTRQASTEPRSRRRRPRPGHLQPVAGLSGPAQQLHPPGRVGLVRHTGPTPSGRIRGGYDPF